MMRLLVLLVAIVLSAGSVWSKPPFEVLVQYTSLILQGGRISVRTKGIFDLGAEETGT